MGNNEKEANDLEINPWGDKLIGEEDYVRLCAEFGIQRTEELDIPASVYDKVRSLRRKIIFGHRDFDKIIKKLRTNFSFVALYKPEASRKKSSEIYAVAKKFHD